MAVFRRPNVSMTRVLGPLALASGLALACPGALPCDQDLQNRQLCNGAPAFPDAGITGAPPPVAPTVVTVNAATPLANCARWPNVGAMDGFFASRCGIAASCHGTGTAYTDLGSPFAWVRLPLATTKVSCKGAQVVDTRNWRNSAVWAKAQNPVACPPGSTSAGGLTMPPQTTYDPRTPALNFDEIRCIEGFLRAVTGN